MSAPSLKFRTSDIVEQGGLATTLTLPPESLFPEPQPDASPDGALTASLEFSVGSEEILLQAGLSGGWKVSCGRCLQPHVRRWEASFDETYPAESEDIDVSDGLRETALLEIPQRSLCRPDCAGLCAQCGQNLNEKRCACAPSKPTPFGVLKRLKEQ